MGSPPLKTPVAPGDPDPPEAPPAAPDPGLTESLRRRARLGIIALGVRTVVVQVIVFGGTVALARLLDPSEFGAFAAVQFALSFFIFFGDVGLGGALVRQEEEPTEEQLSTIFWAQIGIAMALITVISIAASFIQFIWSGLPPSAPWLMRALALDLVLTAFRIVPSILLERHLSFGRLAVVEVIVQLSFFLFAVPLAALGLHIWALAAGVLAQGVISLIAILVVRPWRPKLYFDRTLLAPLLKFGIPFQAKNLVALANSAVTPLYAGAMLGTRSLGLINWAQSTAYMPYKLIEIMARVNFPLYSRLQNDKKVFAETLGRSIQLCATVTLGFVALMLGLGECILTVVYGEKWLPALPLLYIYAAAFSLGFLAPVVGAALDAIGKPGLFFRLSLGWTALNWIVVLVTTPRWGMIGFVGGYVVHVIVGNLAVIYVVRKLLPDVKLWPRLRASIVSAAVAGAVGHYLVAPWAGDKLTLAPGIVAVVVAYALVVVAIDPTVLAEIRRFRGAPK